MILTRQYPGWFFLVLTHWGWVTHICVSNLTITGSINGLSPGQRQAINFSEILIEIHTFSFKRMHLKKSSGKWQPFCLGLNVSICVIHSFMRQMQHRNQYGKHTDVSVINLQPEWDGKTLNYKSQHCNHKGMKFLLFSYTIETHILLTC